MANTITSIVNFDTSFKIVPGQFIQGLNLLITIKELQDSSQAWSWLSTSEPATKNNWNTSPIIQQDFGTGNIQTGNIT